MTQERASLREMLDALPALRDDLVREYGASVPTAAIEETARQALAEFDGVPIRALARACAEASDLRLSSLTHPFRVVRDPLGPHEADRRRPCIRARDAVDGRRGPAVLAPVLLVDLVVQTVIRILEQDVRVDCARGDMPRVPRLESLNQAPPGPFTERR
jgi:hypothetical protein